MYVHTYMNMYIRMYVHVYVGTYLHMCTALDRVVSCEVVLILRLKVCGGAQSRSPWDWKVVVLTLRGSPGSPPPYSMYVHVCIHTYVLPHVYCGYGLYTCSVSGSVYVLLAVFILTVCINR